MIFPLGLPVSLLRDPASSRLLGGLQATCEAIRSGPRCGHFTRRGRILSGTTWAVENYFDVGDIHSINGPEDLNTSCTPSYWRFKSHQGSSGAETSARKNRAASRLQGCDESSLYVYKAEAGKPTSEPSASTLSRQEYFTRREIF